MRASTPASRLEEFAHLLTVGCFKPEIGALEDLVASRWKPTRGIGKAHSIREKLDGLPMDVVA
ncbi:hypothetical protein JHK85_001078 [Glycine max]|nr:hypothetical protein JHK85_001078 [Glycine max]